MGISNQEIEKQKQERLGETRVSNEKYMMKIVEYKNAMNMIVEFQDEYKAKILTNYGNFKKGCVKNPYHKSVCNVGYYGQGKYTARGKDGKKTIPYQIWVNMIRRCYEPYELNKRPTYIDCYVCKEWLCFQNFAEWYYKNIYNCNNERMNLDKDILYKNNKIYSPKTCILVPQRINTLFIKRQNDRGKCVIGVLYHKRDDIYEAWCDDANGKQQYLGRFDNELDAFYCYKQFKEKTIKQVADEYKDLIPEKLYEALYKYEVEIND